MNIQYRLAELADVPELEKLIADSARGLRTGFYSNAQIDGALGQVFGVDTQLIRDGTYFVAVTGQRLVGCGGWSKRKSLYGGDRARSGDDALRNPNSEPAVIRAFFVHPDFARRGIGRELLRRAEEGAQAAGFLDVEIVATLPGEALYIACGYSALQRLDVPLRNGEALPVVRMRRSAPVPGTAR